MFHMFQYKIEVISGEREREGVGEREREREYSVERVNEKGRQIT